MKLIELLQNPYRIVPSLGARGRLKWLNDSFYLKLSYRAKLGEHLNLNNPQGFNEKMQWLKLNYRDKRMTNLVDKIESKKIVKELIGKEYIIENLGVWKSFDEINFDKLPDQFVLKTSHDSGGVYICHSKAQISINDLKLFFEKRLMTNYYYTGREWPYKNIEPRIVAEKLLIDRHEAGLRDYKVYCFNGIPKFIQVISNRTENNYYVNYFDMCWEELFINRVDVERFSGSISQPVNLKKMKEFSRVLANKYPFVRVDFYEVDSKLYFGEMTFFPFSGFLKFKKKSDDLLLGSWIDLPKKGAKI